MLETNFYPKSEDMCFIKRLVMRSEDRKPKSVLELLKKLADKPRVVVIWSRDLSKPGSTELHNSYAELLDTAGIDAAQRFVVINPYATDSLKEKFGELRESDRLSLAFYSGSSTTKCYPYLVRYADTLIDVSYGGFRIIKWKE